MLGDREINALAAVPTLLRVLINHADLIGTAGRHMRWIEIGSQHMTGAEKEKLKAIFPEAGIIQHFGLTEASRTTFLDITNTCGRPLESVGRSVGATEIKVLPDGRICIRGPHVAREWIGATGISPLLDDQGWLITNDLGEIDDGFLYFRGRSDDLINFGGIKLVPDLIEDRLRARYHKPPRLVVARIDDPLRGDGILVATDDAETAVDELQSMALEVLATFGVAAGGGLRVAVVPELPFTATGKIRRRALAAMVGAEPLPLIVSAAVDSQLGNEPAPSSSTGSKAIEACFVRAARGAAVFDHTCYIEIGGDSLSFIEALIVVETALGGPRDDWATIPLAELKKAAAAYDGAGVARPLMRGISPDILVRALAIMLVVLQHALGTFEGGADMMMVLGGLGWARFQRAGIAEVGVVRTLWKSLAHLMAIYYIIVLLYSFLKQKLFVSHLLLHATFLGDWGGSLNIYWFIESLAWCIVIASVAYAVIGAERFRRDPLLFTVTLFVLAIGLRYFGGIVFDAHAHRMRSPDQMLVYFAAGALLSDAQMRGKIVVAAILVGISAMAWGVTSSHAIIMAICCAVLVSRWRLLLPQLAHWLLRLVARNSFYIYILQIVPMYLIDQILKAEHGRYWLLHVIISVVAGLGVGTLLDRYDGQLRRYLGRMGSATRNMLVRT